MAEGGGTALREVAAVFGIEFNTKQLEEGMASISGAVGLIKSAAALFAANELVATVREFAHEFAEAGAQIFETSERFEISARNLQGLHLAAEQGGVSAEQLDLALGLLAQHADEARTGTGRAADAFRWLGVHARGANGQVRPVGELLTDVAGRLSSIEDPARRVTIATDLFGRSGRRLLSIMHGGAGGIAELSGQLERLGGGISDDAIRASHEYEASLARWRVALRSVQSILAEGLLPVLTLLNDAITFLTAKLAILRNHMGLVQVVVGALAGVLAYALRGALLKAIVTLYEFAAAQLAAFAPIYIAVAAIVALILVVDDLLALFRGGRSVIGRWIDSMFGVGTSARWVKALKEAWISLTNYLQEAWEGIKQAATDAISYLGEAWQGVQLAATQAWEYLSGLVDQVTDLFGNLWDEVDEALGGALTRMTERVAGWFRDFERRFAFLRTIREAWRDVHELVNGGGDIVDNRTPAAATLPTTHRRAGHHHGGAAAGHTSVSVGPTTINVQGAGDPRAVAEHIDRFQRRRQRVGMDAAHPHTPEPEGA
jgi:hypothetical protein